MAVPLAEGAGGVETVEVDLLLEAVYRHYAFDFRGYARASLRRRLWRRVHAEGVTTISGLQERVLHDPAAMDRLLRDLSINVTEMFRDPGFFAALRTQVVPILRTYPYLRVWNAGCSTGEETVSLAILLEEEGLLERTRLYATDMNDTVLDRARRAAFPLDQMRRHIDNHARAGGKGDLSRYFSIRGDEAVFSSELVGGALFARHNLAQDGPFNEFQLIICRNVLIYFGRPLQSRVHTLFGDSLARLGVLGLGRKESIGGDDWAVIDEAERIYRRTR